MIALTDEFIAQHEPLLASVARQIARKLPTCVDYEDLLAFGRLGLLEAADRFSLGGGACFETFAYYRIRGAILDGVRKMACLPPAARRWVAGESGADAWIENECRGAKVRTADASAHPLGRCVRGLGMVFLLSQLPEQDEEDSDGWAVDIRDGPATDAETRELIQRLRDALQQLSPEQRDVVDMHYFANASFTDVADARKVNKSTITRRHAAAIDSLRSALEVAMPVSA